jgi:NADH-quinone oxidoreductase subunit G
MPKLIIDNREIEVPQGTKVIDAAEQLGIMIPRFCFHPALGSVGACRVCAVKFLQGPFKGIQMSCMIEAADDMVVSTTDEEAVDFRKHVIEWLMLHHPHDCPVCDEGGHCLLQDMTVSGGHGLRRFLGKKRTHHDQYLGPLIQHEMNRCIQCYRCSRFYQEFTGYRDLGVMQIGSRVYFGRYKPGTLESPFAGNLSDICPTGVYTDKPSRYIGRRWDYERSPSVCINCSLGCHLVVSTRYREVVRQEAKFSKRVNGHFICDRGRYGFSYASHRARPRHPRIDGKDAPLPESVRTAAARLESISKESGSAAIACLGSARSSLETQTALKHLCREKRWQGPVYWMDHGMENKVKAAVSKCTADLSVSLRDLEAADFILAVGADPVNEAPMLAAAMRQAVRCGGKVVVLDPRPIHLPFHFDHLPVARRAMAQCIAHLMKETVDPAANGTFTENRDLVDAVATDLQESRRPVIVCGTEVVPAAVPGLAADVARFLKGMNKQAGLFYLMPGANAFGAALLADTPTTFEDILKGIEAGTVKALVLVESNPYESFPDRPRLAAAFEQLDLIIVLDYLDSHGAGVADVFLPTLTLYEAGGLYINQEGRVQKASPAFRGGQPASQIGDGSHPPRIFKNDIPGSAAEAGWRTLGALSGDAATTEIGKIHGDGLALTAKAHPLFANLSSLDAFPDDGVVLSPGGAVAERIDPDRPMEQTPEAGSAGDLELITVDWTFGTEELSVRSMHLRQLEKEPCLFVQNDDATRLGFSDGDEVVIQTDTGTLSVNAAVVEEMAPGILVLPRHRKLAWQQLGASRVLLREDQIRKVSEDE